MSLNKEIEAPKINTGTDRTKVMTNNQDESKPGITMNGIRLETVNNFRCKGFILSGVGSNPRLFRPQWH